MKSGKNDDSKLQIAAFNKIAKHWLLSAPVDEMSDEEATGAWLFLDLMESLSKGRKEELRQRMFERLEEIGSPDENGTITAKIDGTTVVKEKRTAKLPDPKVVEKLLMDAEMNISEAFDTKTSWEMNSSKVDFLVQGGKLSKEALDKSKKVSYALKIRPSGSMKSFLSEAKK